MTGDLPTPVKYHSPRLRSAYREMEVLAQMRLMSMLPEELREGFAPYVAPEYEEASLLVKAADRLSAYVKCL